MGVGLVIDAYNYWFLNNRGIIVMVGSTCFKKRWFILTVVLMQAKD